jgi:hypothetical protein
MKPLKSTAPPHSILSSAFSYKNASSTDVAATFERVRAEMAKAKPVENVKPIRRTK